jgi:transposase
MSLGGGCQPTSNTEPAPTPKVSHPEAIGKPLPAASAAGQESVFQRSSAAATRSTAGVGFGVVKASSAHREGGMVVLEGVMETPEELLVMRQLLERGWSRRRIATELGISRHTVNRYLALGEWQPYSTANRTGQLDGHLEWLQQQFEQHHGNAEVLRQELLKQKGIRVSQRTVERAVQPWREALRQSAQATVRYENRPGKQLQAAVGM